MSRKLIKFRRKGFWVSLDQPVSTKKFPLCHLEVLTVVLYGFDVSGNIRVFCRIRPTINGENFRQGRPVVPVDSNGILLKFTEKKTKLYNFDKILHPRSSQGASFFI